MTLFNRGRSERTSDTPTIRGDLAELEQHRAALLASEPDVVVHCIANSAKHAQAYRAVFSGLEARSVVLSSMDCYEAFFGARQGLEVSDFPIDETMPTCSQRKYWSGTQHSNADEYDKNELTDELLSAHSQGDLQVTVLRLPMVYGPHDRQFAHRHGPILHHCLDRRPHMVLGASEAAAIWTFGYVENIAAGVLHAGLSSAANGGVYNLGERKQRSKRRWLELYGEVTGQEIEAAIVPDELLGRAGGAAPPHLIFDSSKFARETGFQPPFALDEALHRTYRYAADHREALGDPPDYASRDAALTRWRELSSSENFSA